jgi:hypothetical protein
VMTQPNDSTGQHHSGVNGDDDRFSMKAVYTLVFALSFVFLTISNADTLVLQSRSVTGTVLQTNGDNVLLLTDFGTLNYSLGIIKEIKIDRAEAVEFSATSRLPDARSLVLFLSRLSWAVNLKQIPATVIDKGILKNVPYISYRAGDDYEINVYGDPNDPAGIEAGTLGKLLNDGTAKNNCIGFLSSVLGRAADKEVVKTLNAEKDLKTSDGLTFEITPPSAEDSYGGWWVSVYSEQKLKLAQASEAEMREISVTKTAAVRESLNGGDAWSAGDLKLARQPQPTTITFTTTDGETIKDADVVSVMDGVGVVWRKGASGGVVKLANLPEELRRRFGYDPAKAAYAEEVEKAKRRQTQAEIQTAQATAGSAAVAVPSYDPGLSSSGGSSGGSVYVRSYTRRTPSGGTVTVSGYTRRR